MSGIPCNIRVKRIKNVVSGCTVSSGIRRSVHTLIIFLQPTTTSSPQEPVATAAGPPVENLVSVSPADSPAKKSITGAGEGVVASEGGSTAGNRLDDLIKSLQKGDASEETITTPQVNTYYQALL